jgi:CHAT domain-containing protein
MPTCASIRVLPFRRLSVLALAAVWLSLAQAQPQSPGRTDENTARSGAAQQRNLAVSPPIPSGNPAIPSLAVPRTIADVMALLARYEPDRTALSAARERLGRPPVDAAAGSGERLRDLAERAAAAARIGDQAQRLAFAREAGKLVGSGPLAYRILNEWANAEEYSGNLAEGIRIRELSRNRYASGSGRIGDNAALADSYAGLGDLAAGKALLEDSEQIYARLSHSSLWQYNHEALIERQRGDFASRAGRYEEAEAAYLKAFTAADRDIPANRQRLASGMDTPSQDVIVSMRDSRGAKLARTLLTRGRTSEAEWYARDLVRMALEYSGPSHPSAARAVGLLGDILLAQGRFVEAEALARTRLHLLIGSGIVDPSGQLAGARGQIASTLVAQERWREALEEFEGRQRGAGGDAVLLRQIESNSLDFAIALLHADQFDRAESLLDARYRWWLEHHGAAHPQTATMLAFGALARGGKGQLGRALDELALAFPLLEEQERHAAEEDAGGFLRAQRLRWIAEGYLGLLVKAAERAGDEAQAIIATAFRVADTARRSSVQRALAATAARAAIRDPKLADLARREQDAGQRATALGGVLGGVLARPPEQQLPKIVADLRRDIEALGKERASLRRQIEREFPDYADLVSPRPVTLELARAVLEADEALLAIYAGSRESYVWAFGRDGAVAFARAALGRDAIAQQVTQLRRAVDPGDIDLMFGIPDYDVGAAHRLYAALLAPVATAWKARASLIVATSGVLGQLPLAMLPTVPVTRISAAPGGPRYGAYRQVPWLVRQIAVTQIPSISALVGLRHMPAPRADRAAFVGFGDPWFGADNALAGPAAPRRIRNLHLGRPRPLTAAAIASGFRTRTAGTESEWIAYQQIPPLPDTRDEVLALARALGADIEKDVFLGPAASTRNVRALDLSKRRVIAFATHGLLPGDFPGVGEPALALANPGDGRHGLLTLSDVLGLKLDADWVVLSACNTAAGDGAGADAISGLGRGFFYAGSRALLVTHWPVESSSARTLVTGIFERYAADPSLSRAEALRQSMLALMQMDGDGISFAHPLFWAPYALVGDGGHRR